ncbi:MAG: phosphomethylpyrimidine synthase ThiC [Limnochordia bacterium]|jgi:phosphomethylpyrimidine synthase
MTQILRARRGEITPEMQAIAADEGLSPEEIREKVAQGLIVIPKNKRRNTRPVGIGSPLRTKVNANVGTSVDWPHADVEVAKAKIAWEAGADTIMDLSTGGDLFRIRQQILQEIPLPLGTVPVYQAMVQAREEGRPVVDITTDEIFQTIEVQAEEGVDFVTVHCGLTRKALQHLQREGRVTDIVSRGGAFHAGWMLHNDAENPLYEHYDRLLDLALEYDLTLSLGDGMRPGSLADATDRAQVQELITLGELVQRAWERGVQVMVEGPGHLPLDQVELNIKLQKSLCQGAPFYVLGPLVTDIAVGYDHIAAAIGGALAAAFGADFLCYVTPAEHIGLPSKEDVRQGVMAARLAAHAGDLVKGQRAAWEWDRKMAQARKALDWDEQIQLALDSPLAAELRRAKNPSSQENCSMCGPYCAMRLVDEHLKER